MHDLITVRCDGCGDTRYDCGQWMTRATHRVLGVFCGRFVGVREDDMDDVVPLPTDELPRYVAQVEEAQAELRTTWPCSQCGETVKIDAKSGRLVKHKRTAWWTNGREVRCTDSGRRVAEAVRP